MRNFQLIEGRGEISPEIQPPTHAIHPHVAKLASIMDDCFLIPGTNFRIGLDGIIGLFPVVGDLATIAIGGLFIQEAKRLGASRWTIARMYGNYALDLMVGVIPLVGDAFDFAFKAHRRNFRILERHVAQMSAAQAVPRNPVREAAGVQSPPAALGEFIRRLFAPVPETDRRLPPAAS